MRAKMGEETNKTAKPRKAFLNKDYTILGKISKNQVLKIKEV